VRQLLRLPQRPAILWLGAAWRDFSSPEVESRHTCTSEAQRPILEHYSVPQVYGREAMPTSTCAFHYWHLAQTGTEDHTERLFACARQRRVHITRLHRTRTPFV